MIRSDEMNIKICEYYNGRAITGRGVLVYDVRDDMWKGLMICNGWVDYLEACTLDEIMEDFEEMVETRE